MGYQRALPLHDPNCSFPFLTALNLVQIVAAAPGIMTGRRSLEKPGLFLGLKRRKTQFRRRRIILVPFAGVGDQV